MIGIVKRSAALRLRRLLPRFVRHQKGATAVEFGLIALPFLALFFAIIETALLFFAGQTLETAAADSARLILTGQAQQQGLTQATFKTEVCKRITALMNCSDGIYVDVKKYSSFGAVTSPNPVSNGTLDPSSFTYVPGAPGDIIVVRLYYQWPITVAIWNAGLINLNGSKRLLVATSAFRNEPYN
jgi:Flp pilus assembly protein TadG